MMPRLSQSLIRNYVYPVYRILRRDRLVSLVQDLEKSQWRTAEEFENLRWQGVGPFLKQVTAHVPYYRDLFKDAGLRAEDVRSPSDFLSVPLLTKEDIRREKARMVTQEPSRRGSKSSTSGSTGAPLYFYCDQASRPARRAAGTLSYRWAGLNIGDRIAHMWGFHMHRPIKDRVVSSVTQYFNNRLTLSSFHLSEGTMHRYADKLSAFKPDAIDGYPSTLAVFAEFCRDHRIRDVRPRVILLSGEKTYPHQHDVIQEVFDCPVFNRYGTNEFSIIAQDCDRHEGLHLLNPSLYVEVIHESGRPAESEEVGEIVITDLENLYMPFVRYRTGDLAVPTTRRCSCGRGSSILDGIEGRVFDVVVTADGRSAGGTFWTHLSRLAPGIKQFQIEQRDRRGVIFRIVRGPEWKDEYAGNLEREIKDNLGDGFGVDFEFVDDVPLTAAGKFRFVWSRIDERAVTKPEIH